MFRVFLIDCETTGLQPSSGRILEMAVWRYIPSQSPEFIYPLSTLVRHCEPIPSASTRIHGITNEMTMNAPHFLGAWSRILAYINTWAGKNETVLLVAHNARFDMSFIRAELERHNLPIPAWLVSCSLLLARYLWPTTSYKLHDLAHECGVQHHFLRDAHRAKADVRLLAKVLDSIANRIQPRNSLHGLILRYAAPFN